ncbi:acyl-CoA dehydrogenase family protein [Aureimonas leprariae]|uniref:Acyl-CoA dehydrogenase n=1 Tax=Plantimonas leprariae TaxID=2615207 RepID=A0A7V7U229_9HYPH|nr:acyl-CoA dehydrogenase family protein [Aureimonas leprariae]KAB0682928.1 acyl-CoA dehydrogenase [Aureimonas leprariae]
MRLDPIRHAVDADDLAAEIGRDAAKHDRDGSFPAEGFDALRRHGLVGWPPLAPGEIGRLLRLLAAVGRGDLSVGRIYEGHVNALFLIRAYGTADQRDHLEAAAARGELFGVWNTDAPDRPLRFGDDGCLEGAKNFSSGVDGLAQAVVTVPSLEGRRMLVVPLDGRPVDRSWWHPMGMRASGSHIVDFEDLPIRPEWLLGSPDDYVRPPWFFAGAIRFAAVHVGGMHAVFDTALQHLQETGRAGDPYQLHRLARMGIAVEEGYNWLDRTALAWEAAAADPAAGDSLVATANAARSAIEAHALAVLEEAERSVGAAGMIAPHPLERLVRDLRTYLRQPNPDGALASFGKAVAEGGWRPGRAGLPAKGGGGR